MKEEIDIKRKKIRKRGKIVIIIIIMLFITCIVYGFYNKLETTYYTYQSENLPKEFDGYRIAFISDFHCKKEGKSERKLIMEIDDFNPDLVVFTGDMIDSEHKDITPVKELLDGLADKYKMYAINGNHERDIDDTFEQLKFFYSEFGVTYLCDTSDTIIKNGASISIYGNDYKSYYSVNSLKGPDKDRSKFNILLVHDSTAFPIYRSFGFDLILAGHTHGGIIRVPMIGGLINTHGSLIAKYDNGMYQYNGTTMISSRGVGDAFLPRFNNRSELVCVTLVTKKD